MLRIIGGEFKGRRLKVPAKDVRPTTDRVREAIFNILGQHLDQQNILDLYAGSGALGLEALSRGADFTTFVDSSARSAQVIGANIRQLGCQQQTRVKVQKATTFVVEAPRLRFDTVFADPPYRELPGCDFWQALCKSFIADGGRLVIEHAASVSVDLGTIVGDVDIRRYGDSAVTLVVPE